MFFKANPEVSIALVPTTKSQWDFGIGLWNIAEVIYNMTLILNHLGDAAL